MGRHWPKEYVQNYSRTKFADGCICYSLWDQADARVWSRALRSNAGVIFGMSARRIITSARVCRS
ncbi:UNVERIFIED_CONTAM: hypothetical protein Sangu_0437400 [Sesamum angustifolium]|uniref:Uncharacterized protein n=1 Tax=Sesamum angustifolium TaxID=2727405 RepID=A0AAW2QU11_9LAMI